ncbi:MAG: K+/H+ antiporter subunit F [Marivibrio sp.]|uniref:K+/H+ antiporter subunit F n=1 Tax=Marivibrio sp. TaxID=2039719 RepID=UPI0032EBBC14
MIEIALLIGFFCFAIALILNLYRLAKGPSIADRVLALDTMVINGIAILILYGMYEGTAVYFEASLLFAMVGFLSTVAYCKFILRGDIIE